MPIPKLSPEMIQQLGGLTSQTGQGLQGAVGNLAGLASGNQQSFEQQEAPIYSAYNKQIGQLGSRFAGFGALGSSAFQNATAGATSDLAQNLMANRQNMQNGSIDRLLQLYQLLLGNQTAEEEDPGFDWGGFFGNIGGGALSGLLSGGPGGALAGAGLGGLKGLSGAFNK